MGKKGGENTLIKGSLEILSISSEGPTTEHELGLNKDSHVSTNYKVIGWQVSELT